MNLDDDPNGLDPADCILLWLLVILVVAGLILLTIIVTAPVRGM